MSVRVVSVRHRVLYSRVAEYLRKGIDLIRTMEMRELPTGHMSTDEAQEWDMVRRAMKEAITIVNRGPPRVGRAQAGKVKQGRTTKERVLTLAEQMKTKNPRLSKIEAARRITKKDDAPCKLDRAKTIINNRWNKADWEKLG